MAPITTESNTKTRILELIKDREISGNSKLCRILDKDKSTVSQHISELEDSGLLEVSRFNGRPNLLELTREGFREAVGSQEPKGGDSEDGISLHNFSVKFPIRFSENLDKGWKERWAQGKTRSGGTYDPTNGSYVYFLDNWKFRITGSHVIVRLESELRGEDASNLKDRAMREVFEARDWLQDNSPVKIESKPKDFRIWVNRQHLAIVKDPFCELVDQYSTVDLEDVKIFDSEGTERLWLDNSNNENHLEAGNSPGENRVHAEDDINRIKEDVYEYVIDNPEAFSEVKEFSKDRDHVYSALAYLLEKEKDRQETKEPVREEPETSEKDSKVIEGSRAAKLKEFLTFQDKWIDQHGNLVGYAKEIGRQVKLLDSEVIWS